MTPGDLEGSVIGPIAHRVDRERIDAFVEATGDRKERWTDHAPPGYAASLLFSVAGILLNDSRIRPYLATLIHVDQQFSYHAPFDIDTEVEMTGTVERVRERSGAFFVTFTAAGIADGDLILESRSTFLMSDQAAAASSTDRIEPAVGDRGPNVPAAPAAPAGPFEAGTSTSNARSASRADLVRYAAATKDFNPLHWDHATARSAGLDGVVVHGLLMLSWLAQQASAFTSGPAPISTIKARFRSALAPAAAATIEAVATDAEPASGEAKVALKLSAGGTDVVTGNASVRLGEVTR